VERAGRRRLRGVTTLPPLRYLAAADVEAAMPPLVERLALAERTMAALVADAELPAKIGVHPRLPASFGHAMPAFLRGLDETGADDLLGMKWVVGFPTNGAIGLPAITALVLLDDARTGLPLAILDGTPITAARTAAVSGVAIRHFAPSIGGRPGTVAVIGAGAQGQAHLAMLGHTLPGCELRLYDRHPDRLARLVVSAEATPGIAAARPAASVRAAVDAADVVVTAVSFGPQHQVLPSAALAPDALVVAVDYATMIAAEVARDAALFLVDERGQFEANRSAGAFEDYPDPAATLGEAILAATPRPEHGRVLVTHLGVGLADVIFGDAILRAATKQGLGVVLPR
jgi:ornithine cyclodeaminase/alanine dehydrogenase-like protein (mu-crystallin family)